MATLAHNAFGVRLRQLREQTRPEEVGLPPGQRRRVSGLRRDELAVFSGLSVDYLIRLEQGHAQHPSADVVGALGRALRLSRMELELLHQLAGHAAPSDLEVPRYISPGVQRMIDRLSEVPIAAYDATWTLVVSNAQWRRLHGTAGTQPGYNLVRAAFSADAVEGDPLHQDDFRRALLADLQIAAARYPGDVGMQHLIRDLFANDLAFAAMWTEARARPFATEEKLLRHPDLGEFWLNCDVLTAAEGDTRIVLYTAAAGSPGERALAAMAGQAPQPAPAATRST